MTYEGLITQLLDAEARFKANPIRTVTDILKYFPHLASRGTTGLSNYTQSFLLEKYYTVYDMILALQRQRDVTSFLNTIYKAAVATTSPVVHSVKAIKVSGAGILRPELTKIKGKIITFTQSDKQSLIKSGYNDVNTSKREKPKHQKQQKTKPKEE